MIFVRVIIVKGIAVANLSKAVTIAVRYSAVRRQSEIKPGLVAYLLQNALIFLH